MGVLIDKIKILLVDDHAIFRDSICALLGLGEDFEIVGEASEGNESIKKTQELAPDVILMDIAMPGMDGLEATRRINEENSGVKVLALTQYDNKEYVLSAIKAGAAGYIPKRALGSELVSAIRAVHKGDSFLYPSAAAALIDSYLQRVEAGPRERLTRREREILKFIAEGYTSREIAAKLSISLKTVLNHRMRMMKKLDVHNRTGLIKYAVHNGLVVMHT